MTEYDYSPEAYDRYKATQNRIANWVDKTEQHRAEFQPGDARDLPRSGPVSRRPHPSPPRRQISGQPQPTHLPHPPPSESSDSSDSYYEGPWPQKSPPMVLPRHQQPVMQQPRLPSPQRVSHHHRHRPRTHRRSVSHQSPLYYLPPPPLPLGYQYTYPTVMSAGHQGYTTMPPYGATQPVMSNSSQQLPRSAPGNVATFSMPPANYFQPQFTSPPATAHLQPTSAFLAPSSQPSSQQGVPWSTYGATSPPYSMTSTPAGSPLQYATYQPFAVQQPAQQPCIVPPNVHQRVYDLSKPDSNKYYRRSVG